MHTPTESPRQSEWKRGKEVELSEVPMEPVNKEARMKDNTTRT